ncbi:MAG: heme ABC transporter ATP-binding protein [Rhizobiaceae bacterium]|nr:heme ABC transporter ATP-binding protein [Rhizobiaceae bacterium]
MLSVSHLNVSLARKQIIKDISFEVPSGTFCSIVGPNGSGKTTTLRALTGEIAYRGSVQVNNLDIKTTHPAEMAALRGVLPQSSQLAFPFTVYEVVSLGQLSRTYMLLDREGIIAQALEKVGLANFGRRFYQELSGGEQQRVQLARVLVQVWEPVWHGMPRALFLDEPISSLDIRHQIQIMKIARQYCDDGGIVVAVLHDLNLTAAYSDQIVLLKDGTIHSIGQPQNVLTKNNLEAVYHCTMHVAQNDAHNQLQITPVLA